MVVVASPRGLGTKVDWVPGYSRHLVSVLTAQLEVDSITFSFKMALVESRVCLGAQKFQRGVPDRKNIA